jgi:outer membrane translocation and assembly module TamA
MALELAAFADVGTAWNESRELSMNRTRGGVGVGVRLLTPFYLRCDVGWSPEGGFRFHFSGGPKPQRQRDRLR